MVSLKSGLFCTRYIQLKFEIELSNYRAIFNSIYNYLYNCLYSNDDVYNIYDRILFKINFSSILFKIIYFKYSKFAKIAKIKILNWPRFYGLLQSPQLKTFRPRKGTKSKVVWSFNSMFDLASILQLFSFWEFSKIQKFG